MGQIPRSIERISSCFNKSSKFTLHSCHIM